MVYLIAYLLWCSTKCYHGNIKTKTTGWYHKWKQYADKGTKGKDVSQIYPSTDVESFTDADYQVLTDRAVEQEESASNLRLHGKSITTRLAIDKQNYNLAYS